MGGCFSSVREDLINNQQKPSSAYVVSANGELHQYTVPIKVDQILQSECPSDSPDSVDKYFVCNSDRLYFDEYIPSLDAEEELECGQIYFVLPKSKLGYRLAASEMAALAVKASVALDQINRRGGGRRKRRTSKISPENSVNHNRRRHDRVNNIVVSHSIISSSSSNIGDYDYSTISTNNQSSTGKLLPSSSFARSGSKKSKLTRYSSRRAKLAVRSFKIKLSTIYEGSVLYYT